MASGLRVEDRLDGQRNFGAWKERIISVLDEADVWDIVENTMTVPTDATQLAAYNRKCAKVKRLILDDVKDHVIPHVRGKDHAFDVWEDLTKLYQSSNENRKMALRNKMKAIKMKGSEGVVA